MSTVENFQTFQSASLAVAGTSASVTFTNNNNTGKSTFLITNKGSNGAYIGWGAATATAVASSGTPAANCAYIASGAIMTLDFPGGTLTIAAIQDGGTTTLEISIGAGA